MAENPQPLSTDEIVCRLKQDIGRGESWYLALLDAVRAWPLPAETFQARSYAYLIGGEAFDWLLLAERLLAEIGESVPEAEREALLFHNRPPLGLPPDEFKKRMGSKYRQYLNYFYGVIVEQALILAVEDEVRKERRVAGLRENVDVTSEAFRRVYGATKAVMLNRFRKEKGHPQHRSIDLSELKEFTYWLFKYRFKHSDKALVASDTKKALNWLQASGTSAGL